MQIFGRVIPCFQDNLCPSPKLEIRIWTVCNSVLQRWRHEVTQLLSHHKKIPHQKWNLLQKSKTKSTKCLIPLINEKLIAHPRIKFSPDCLKSESFINSNLHYTRSNIPKRETSLRVLLRIIEPGQHSFSRRNVTAVTSLWQHCVQFDRPEIWTSNLSLQRRTS